MLNARHTSLMPLPSTKWAIKRERASVTEHALNGINTSRRMAKSVAHVCGTFRHLSLKSVKIHRFGQARVRQRQDD